jgi:hypothetical protein
MQFVGGLLVGLGIGAGSMMGRGEDEWKATERDKVVLREMFKAVDGMKEKEKDKVHFYKTRMMDAKIMLYDDYMSRNEIKELAIDLRKIMEEGRRGD